jgi:hypothetical protein
MAKSLSMYHFVNPGYLQKTDFFPIFVDLISLFLEFPPTEHGSCVGWLAGVYEVSIAIATREMRARMSSRARTRRWVFPRLASIGH